MRLRKIKSKVKNGFIALKTLVRAKERNIDGTNANPGFVNSPEDRPPTSRLFAELQTRKMVES